MAIALAVLPFALSNLICAICLGVNFGLPVGMWELSEEDELIDQIGVYTYDKLETLKVDLQRRKFIWKDGKALSIDQVAQRLHKVKPHMPVEDIEDSVMSWLVEAYEPEGITDGDMEEEA